MAVEFGDHSSGFRHIEVIRFINNEVLMNGGGPEFYMTFRSRSWNEIEDQLHTILVDPKVPRSLKRACTWSALALSVRVAARQREQQTRRVGRLQNQVGERETASWTLASELQRLREERDQAAAQLVSTQTALQEAMDEREVLRGRLLQAERSALADVPEPRMRQRRAAVWSLEEEVGSREAQNTANLAGQMPISPILSYLPGLPGPWVQAVHPFLRMPVPHPLPLNSQLPLGLPYSTPVPCPVVMESGATTAAMTAVIPQMAPAAICPPGLWVTLGSQETMASAWDQVCHRQNECSEFLQHASHLGDSVSHSEGEGPQKPQGTPPHGDSSNNNQKESHVVPQVMAATEKKNPGKDQVTAALEVDSNHSIKEESVMPQGMASQENNPNCAQKKYPGIPRKVVGLRDSINHNTNEDSVSPQETATQVNKTSPILKKYPGILLRRPGLESSLSYKQKEDPKISQETATLGEDNRNCKQEDMITFQQMIPQATGGSPSEWKDQVMPQVTGKSQNRKEEPNRFQASPLGKSKSYCVNKCPSKHLPPKQKSKPPQETKAFECNPPQGPPQRAKSSEAKQHEKVFSYRTQMNWVCPSCKAVNRSWSRGCYKCAKAGAQFQRKYFDPKPTY
ncbi:testis-expressed protein 13C-1-like [Peromyscus californicus insignis]|uniref:testis-expressed protein 13C-1-like n=1 Tax=Peromyscus californicus insignis TaxID=564181 RepID=UPI0022A76942|nr:testis-expressed protein 13C-1-like [Peromyscus californicus insignis]